MTPRAKQDPRYLDAALADMLEELRSLHDAPVLDLLSNEAIFAVGEATGFLSIARDLVHRDATNGGVLVVPARQRRGGL